MDIPLEEIETVKLEDGWRWRGVRIRCASREEAVSGLSRGDATALADALEAGRVHWWRRALAAQAGPLRSVYGRLDRLADPPGYTTRGVFSDLRRDAEKAAGRFPSRWSDRLPMTPEFRMLNGILDFLKDPDRVRTNANKTFVANELTRSWEFFDKVEARPLTDEQRRAVVVDEGRNLGRGRGRQRQDIGDRGPRPAGLSGEATDARRNCCSWPSPRTPGKSWRIESGDVLTRRRLAA